MAEYWTWHVQLQHGEEGGTLKRASTPSGSMFAAIGVRPVPVELRPSLLLSAGGSGHVSLTTSIVMPPPTALGSQHRLQSTLHSSPPATGGPRHEPQSSHHSTPPATGGPRHEPQSSHHSSPPATGGTRQEPQTSHHSSQPATGGPRHEPQSAVLRTDLQHVLEEYLSVLNPGKALPAVTHHVQHFIETDSHAVASKYCRLDPDRLAAAKADFAELEQQGIVRGSKSHWASPLHLVKKKNSMWRPCGNFRRLNLQTKPDRYTCPWRTFLLSWQAASSSAS